MVDPLLRDLQWMLFAHLVAMVIAHLELSHKRGNVGINPPARTSRTSGRLAFKFRGSPSFVSDFHQSKCNWWRELPEIGNQ
jgi:hypothetical protein